MEDMGPTVDPDSLDSERTCSLGRGAANPRRGGGSLPHPPPAPTLTAKWGLVLSAPDASRISRVQDRAGSVGSSTPPAGTAVDRCTLEDLVPNTAGHDTPNPSKHAIHWWYRSVPLASMAVPLPNAMQNTSYGVSPMPSFAPTSAPAPTRARTTLEASGLFRARLLAARCSGVCPAGTFSPVGCVLVADTGAPAPRRAVTHSREDSPAATCSAENP